MLGQHQFPVPLQFSLFWHRLRSLSEWLISPHPSAEPSVPLPKFMHLPSPPSPLTTVSKCIWYLSPMSPPLKSHPVSIFLPSSQSQSCYPAPSPSFPPSSVSNVSLPGFFPNLLCTPTPCPLGIQIILFLGFPSTGKVVEIAECGLPVPEHSYSSYLPREQNLKCGALEGMEMPTLV